MLWLRLLWPTALIIALAVLVAWIVSPWAGLALALAGMAGLGVLQAAQFGGLARWAQSPRSQTFPVTFGPVQPVLERLERFLRHEISLRTELAAELQRVHSAVDYVPDSLVVLDADNLVQWSNKAAEVLHGIFGRRRPIQHFLRQPEFVEYLQRAEFDDALSLQLSQRPNQSYEIRIHVTPEGQKLMITRDVTDHQRVDTLRRDFIANVSHEIRTPVTVIGGFAETLLTLPLDESSRREYLGTILRQSQTMQRLVDDLLMLSSLENSNVAPSVEIIGVKAMLQALLVEANAISGGRHRIELVGAAPDCLKGSASEIESATRNLLTNAIRYTPSEGTIRIQWDTSSGEGLISVTDTGIGISPEHLPRLTERFYRVDRGRSRDNGGTGLGLAIVKHILQRHEASLRVSSRPGEGSTFALVFPHDRIVSTPAPAVATEATRQ